MPCSNLVYYVMMTQRPLLDGVMTCPTTTKMRVESKAGTQVGTHKADRHLHVWSGDNELRRFVVSYAPTGSMPQLCLDRLKQHSVCGRTCSQLEVLSVVRREGGDVKASRYNLDLLTLGENLALLTIDASFDSLCPAFCTHIRLAPWNCLSFDDMPLHALYLADCTQ